ncbi:MAG: NlpC/P60 family protein [Lachnospiraceae bacterium]|nr:NlpC/P60 family protein [Lachnospiraceae bacterium]
MKKFVSLLLLFCFISTIFSYSKTNALTINENIEEVNQLISAEKSNNENFEGEVSLAGFSFALNRYYDEAKINPSINNSAYLYSPEKIIPKNIAIVKELDSSNLNIRKSASTSSDIVGKLPKGGACIIKNLVKDSKGTEWALVESGEVTGYCVTKYLYMNDEAIAKCDEVGKKIATVKKGVTHLNVRSMPNTVSEIMYYVDEDEQFNVSNEMIITKDDKRCQAWVSIILSGDRDDDDSDGYRIAYIAKQYVSISYEFNWASSMTKYGEGVSPKRVEMLDYAMTFIGTPYVFGGNSLTKGIDCSGFCKQMYEYIGYTIPRISYVIAADKSGKEISVEELIPGDLVFYSEYSDGRISHVAMYLGDNKIIHSSVSTNGIGISTMTRFFSKVVKAVRFIED